jgi:hypothetical protein
MSQLIIKDDYSFVYHLLDEFFDYTVSPEENDWTDCILGDEEEVIRQLLS